jgi:hypothetical protein
MKIFEHYAEYNETTANLATELYLTCDSRIDRRNSIR